MSRLHCNQIPGESGRWQDVRRDSPCPICEKPDWCRVSKDGQWGACRREAGGATKVKSDKNGADVYLHRIGQSSLTQNLAAHSGHANNQPEPTARKAISVIRADAPILDKVYGALLGRLQLSDDHREALKLRGLSGETIADRGYRSYPRTGRAGIAKELHAEFGSALLAVPGFVDAPGVPKLAGSAGLLVPVRNSEGLVVALKVRRDGATEGGKYVYLSNSKYDGPGPGAPVHVPLGVRSPAPTVRLTEGELKADIGTGLSGLPTISVPGVTNWRPAIDVLRTLGANTVRLAFDADALTNSHVARALLACAERLRTEGISVELERWSPDLGKGIDDLLAAGKQPELLAGESAYDAVKAIAKAAGVDVPRVGQSEIATRIHAALEANGEAALYRDQPLLQALARVAVTDAAEWAILRGQLRNAGVRLREFDHAIAPIVRQVRAECPAEPRMESEEYLVSEDGSICRQKLTGDGPVSVVLANFTAQIVEQVTHDDGAELRSVLAIEGILSGGHPFPKIDVSAEEFARMNWPISSWDTRAVVSAGMSAKDHLRAAIQLLSPRVTQRIIYGHTGWRQIGDKWFYLHLGGAIGPNCADASIMVSLPDALAGFEMPCPPSQAELAAAVRASLAVLDLAPGRITFPVVSAVYRAVLGNTDFSLHLAGPTGVFKSELTALAQQHFGVGMDARHLPGSWSSTGNALEAIAFAAKDALLAVDDFAPTGSTGDIQRFHREADRLLRAQGNRSGRQRMRADGTLRPAKPPRRTILSTGEDVPRGQSSRARQFVLDVGPGEIDQGRLTDCQRHASDGHYAQALSGFIQWLSPQYGLVAKGLRTEVTQLRDSMRQRGHHARTPGIVADLAVGLKYFLAFAAEVKAVTKAESEALWKRVLGSLNKAAEDQAAHQETTEPTRHFLRLLTAALASGRAHVANPTGDCPAKSPEAWGWRVVAPQGENTSQLRQPLGRRIGWLDEENLYLEPEASFAEVQRLAGEQEESLAVSAGTLRKRLREKNLLLSWDEVRKTNTDRRVLEGRRREIIHLHAACITGENLTNPTTPNSKAGNAEENGQFPGQFVGQFDQNGASDLTTKTDHSAGNGQAMVSLVRSETGGEGSKDLKLFRR